MKPTAPLRYNFSEFAMTPCRSLSLSRWTNERAGTSITVLARDCQFCRNWLLRRSFLSEPNYSRAVAEYSSEHRFLDAWRLVCRDLFQSVFAARSGRHCRMGRRSLFALLLAAYCRSSLVRSDCMAVSHKDSELIRLTNRSSQPLAGACAHLILRNICRY